MDFIKEINPDKAIVWCGFLAALFTIASIYFTYLKGVKDGEKQETLQSRVDTTLGLGKTTFESVRQIQRGSTNLQHEVSVLKQLNQNLSEANSVINDNITGGSSSCYVEFIPTVSPNVAYVMLKQVGKYPLRELEIFILDNITGKTYEKHYGVVKVNTGSKFVMAIPFSGSDNLFSIFISSFNNQWNEQVLISPSTSRSRGQIFESVYRVYNLRMLPNGKHEYTLIKQARMHRQSTEEGYGLDDWGKYKTHLTDTGRIELSIK